MSDIIFALKGRKANLAMKLQSCVKKLRVGEISFQHHRRH